MSNFIKLKGQTAVNLELVTQIWGLDNDGVGICFEFDCMNSDELHEITWEFSDKDEKKAASEKILNLFVNSLD